MLRGTTCPGISSSAGEETSAEVLYHQFYCTPLKKGVLNERVAQTSAVATRPQPPKPAPVRDAGFAAPCGGAGMWLGFSRDRNERSAFKPLAVLGSQ